MTARFMPQSDRLDSRQSSHGGSEAEKILPKMKIKAKGSFAKLVKNESYKNTIEVNIR